MKTLGIVLFIIILFVFFIYSLFLISTRNECTGVSGFSLACFKKQ